jgi:hypothetical protein
MQPNFQCMETFRHCRGLGFDMLRLLHSAPGRFDSCRPGFEGVCWGDLHDEAERALPLVLDGSSDTQRGDILHDLRQHA